MRSFIFFFVSASLKLGESMNFFCISEQHASVEFITVTAYLFLKVKPPFQPMPKLRTEFSALMLA